MKPTISILIPTYNRVGLLKKSLLSALSQDFEDFEVVVSDNASTDDTPIFLQEMLNGAGHPRLKVVRQSSNIGMARNWDVLVKLARGRFFLVLSDDDVLEPSALRVLYDALTQTFEAPLAFCAVRGIDEADEVKFTRSAPNGSLDALSFAYGVLSGRFYPCLCATLYDREKFMATLSFSGSQCQMAMDTVVLLKLALRYRNVGSTSTFASCYRIHNNSASSSSSIDLWMRDMELLAQEVELEAASVLQDDLERAQLKQWLEVYRAHMLRHLLLSSPRPNRTIFEAYMKHTSKLTVLGIWDMVILTARLIIPTPIEAILKRMRTIVYPQSVL
ncbi:glycosyltransferase family 2 protein [Deinococcus yavapaiensis]|uniref:Glycosyl transferase family 2 n=1 Tax=Deinococcus yavapaiensis KR-236 TaxID=694435 RepID=A0A318SF79_9DEIO|nr:glycosyltransferase family A protein [Deinococcus yavapaiensis]PYE55905.1 glycosyl transferase family 2 [Deinococcus yavapaiensis KR-236]